MAVNFAVIYYSSTGTTYQLARAAADGAKEAGAEVRFLKVKEIAPQSAIQSNDAWQQHVTATSDVPEASMDDLEWADAFMLGTPTRFGQASSQLKQYMDQAGPLWQRGALTNKVASSFTSVATAHGGHESTLLSINNTFYHWGCIIVPPGYGDQIQFQSGTPYGTSFISNNGELDPNETALEAAKFQARHMVDIAGRIKNGA